MHGCGVGVHGVEWEYLGVEVGVELGCTWWSGNAWVWSWGAWGEVGVLGSRNGVELVYMGDELGVELGCIGWGGNAWGRKWGWRWDA